LEKIGILKTAEVLDAHVVRVPKTYPAYFGTYDRFEELRTWMDRFENLFLVGRNGMQAGDPVRAGEAIIKALESENPPLHLILGLIALETARTKLEKLRGEIDDWEELSLGADYPESHAAAAS